MNERQQQTDASDPAVIEEEIRTEEQGDAVGKSYQYGQTGDAIDPGLGNMGGAGASGGIQPDISTQSTPTPGNPSDLPANER